MTHKDLVKIPGVTFDVVAYYTPTAISKVKVWVKNRSKELGEYRFAPEIQDRSQPDGPPPSEWSPRFIASVVIPEVVRLIRECHMMQWSADDAADALTVMTTSFLSVWVSPVLLGELRPRPFTVSRPP